MAGKQTSKPISDPISDPIPITGITTTQSDSVLELYSAYFNRAADATGLSFWKKSFVTFSENAPSTSTNSEKESFALQKIAEDISSSTEYTELYPPSQSNTEFVSAIYTNLLNRPSDAEGLSFWSGHIDDGSMTKEQAITQMIAGAKTNTTAQGIKDAALITNKNAISKYFAETLKSDDIPLATASFYGVTNDDATVGTRIDLISQGIKPVETGTETDPGTDPGTVPRGIVKTDYTDDVNTLGVIPVGSTIRSNIEKTGDKDWFKIDLKAGVSYLLSSEGNGFDTHLELMDKNGHFVDNDKGISISIYTGDDEFSNSPATIGITPTVSRWLSKKELILI